MQKKLILLFAIIVIFIFSIAIIFLLYINKNNSKLAPNSSPQIIETVTDSSPTSSPNPSETDGPFPAPATFASPTSIQSSLPNELTPEMIITEFATALREGNIDEALKLNPMLGGYRQEYFNSMSQNEREALADAISQNSVKENGDDKSEIKYNFTMKYDSKIIKGFVNLYYSSGVGWRIESFFLPDNLTPEMVIDAFTSALRNGDNEKALSFVAFDAKERHQKVFQSINQNKKALLADAISQNSVKEYDDDGKIKYRFTMKEDAETTEDTFWMMLEDGRWKIDLL